MLYRWWLLTALTQLVIADMLLRASPFYLGGIWPVGMEYLKSDY